MRVHGDSHAALVAAGIAMALGGAALFGIVAHTKTPFYAVGGTSPRDSLPKVAESSRTKRRAPMPMPAEQPATEAPTERPAAESQTPEAALAVAPPAEVPPGQGDTVPQVSPLPG